MKLYLLLLEAVTLGLSACQENSPKASSSTVAQAVQTSTRPASALPPSTELIEHSAIRINGQPQEELTTEALIRQFRRHNRQVPRTTGEAHAKPAYHTGRRAEAISDVCAAGKCSYTRSAWSNR